MKLVLRTLIIATLFISQTTYAITAADVEMLITIGLIKPENVAAARAAISSGAFGGTVAPKVSTPSVLTQSSDGCVLLPRNLLLNTRDTSVTLLQQFLRKQGYFSYPENTDYYGSLTRDAVVSFQLAQGLITSASQLGAGNVGPATIAKIKELTCVEKSVTAANNGFADISAISTFENQKKGQQKYKYTLSMDPSDEIEKWRLKLVCDDKSISTNRKDLADCGETVEIKARSSGKQTFSILYKNISASNQMVGILAEAVTAEGNIIDVAESINYVRASGELKDIQYALDDPGYTVTFTGSSSTEYVNPKKPTTFETCATTELKKAQEIWARKSQTRWWSGEHPLINIYGLPESQIARHAELLSSRIRIVEPDNRTVSELIEAYGDDYLFPDTAYVSYLKQLGEKYNKTNKNWLPLNETEKTLETKRKEIQTIIPGMPSAFITKEQIGSGDQLVMLGELFQHTQGNTNYYAPTAHWAWQGREFGIDLDKYRIYNGTVATGGISVCGGLSNNLFDIVLIRK